MPELNDFAELRKAVEEAEKRKRLVLCMLRIIRGEK